MQRIHTTLQLRPTAQAAARNTTRVRVYCCDWLLDRTLRSVIRHRFFLFCCAAHVRPVCRAPLKITLRIFRNMVKRSRCPILDLKARVWSYCSRDHIFCFSSCVFNFILGRSIMCVTQTPQTTNITWEVQGAINNQLATTLYTPATRQQSRKQHHACAVVCPHWSAVASYIVVFYRTMRSVELGGSALSYQVHTQHAATGTARCCCCCSRSDFRGQPRLVNISSPCFGAPYYIPVTTIALLLILYFCVPWVCGRCVPSVMPGVRWSLFFAGSPRISAAGVFFAVIATTKIPRTWYAQ